MEMRSCGDSGRSGDKCVIHAAGLLVVASRATFARCGEWAVREECGTSSAGRVKLEGKGCGCVVHDWVTSRPKHCGLLIRKIEVCSNWSPGCPVTAFRQHNASV